MNKPPSITLCPDDHPDIITGRVGVLIVNLGTPEATDYWSMRRYLREFLEDRRVVEAPRLLWLPLLHGVILTLRPQKSGRAYEKIWNRERNESPLRTITRNSARKLAAQLEREGVDCRLDWAMRYGAPSIASRLEALRKQGCDRILLAPLYPQYSATTTASVCDKAYDALRRMRHQPSLRTLPPYFRDPAYIDALADNMLAALDRLDFEPEIVLTSFHGLPQEYFDRGDPYYCHCAATKRLLRQKLGWDKERLLMTFQSRFGPKPWLQPYTDRTIEALGHAGVKKIAVVMPGFAADCVETLEETGVENRDIFLQNGGEHFAALPCLNDSPQAIDMMTSLVKRELQGWRP